MQGPGTRAQPVGRRPTLVQDGAPCQAQRKDQQGPQRATPALRGARCRPRLSHAGNQGTHTPQAPLQAQSPHLSLAQPLRASRRGIAAAGAPQLQQGAAKQLRTAASTLVGLHRHRGCPAYLRCLPRYPRGPRGLRLVSAAAVQAVALAADRSISLAASGRRPQGRCCRRARRPARARRRRRRRLRRPRPHPLQW